MPNQFSKPPRTYWKNLSDEQLVDADLETDDPEGLENLITELPENHLDAFVEYKYDLRGTDRPKFQCVHGHHPHLKGFVMRLGTQRFLVGWLCADSTYGENWKAYTADFNAALNRQRSLRRRAEIGDALAPLTGWMEQVQASKVLDHFNNVRAQLQQRMPWIIENGPSAELLGYKAQGITMPIAFFSFATDPASRFAKVSAELGVLIRTLRDQHDVDSGILSKVKASVDGYFPRLIGILDHLEEVVTFFQPAVLNVICEFANRRDNPAKRRYTSDLVSISCKKRDQTARVQLPASYRIPDRNELDRIRDDIRML